MLLFMSFSSENKTEFLFVHLLFQGDIHYMVY